MQPLTHPHLRTKTENDRMLEACVRKYADMRVLAREVLEEEVCRAYRIKTKMLRIDEAALTQAEAWPHEFNWRAILRTFRKSHPRGFDLAMWSGGHLCGLAVVRLSDSRQWLSVTHVEGSSHPSHPLKRRVAFIAAVGADVFGSLIQAQCGMSCKPQVRMMNPQPGTLDWYRGLGYSELHKRNGYSFLTLRGPS